MRRTFIVLFIVCKYFSFGQEEFTPNFFPSAPTLSKFEIYGNENIDLFNGSHKINIPFYKYKNKVLDIPITLNYTSNGIKVDEMESILGLVWNLNSFGSINRLIKDIGDEDMNGYESYGYNLSNISLPQSLDPFTLEFIQLLVDGEVDSESDIFSYNTISHNGNFVINRSTGRIMTFPKTNLRIEVIQNVQNEFEFLITDSNGIQYFFTVKEKSRYSSSADPFVSYPRISSLYLSKIANNADTIYFKYKPLNYSFTNSQSQTLSYTYPFLQEGCGDIHSQFRIGPKINHYQNVQGFLLDSIYTNNISEGFVKFEYINNSNHIKLLNRINVYNKDNNLINYFHFNYFKNANDRVFLTSINSNEIVLYKFEYESPNYFPPRLSNSQDHWGYFNNKSNTRLISNDLSDYGLNIDFNGANREADSLYTKIGLLSNIIHPTKGRTSYEYEPNSYYSTVPNYNNLAYSFIAESGFGEYSSENYFEFTSNTNQEISIHIDSDFGTLCDEEFEIPGRHDGRINVFNITTQRYVPIYRYTFYGQMVNINNQYPYSVHIEDSEPSQTFFFGASSSNTYKIEIATNTYCTKVYCLVNYKSRNGTVRRKVLSGGVRIKSLQNLSTEDSPNDYMRFFYKSIFNPELNSIIPSNKPYYLKETQNKYTCPDSNPIREITNIYRNISSSSYISLFHPESNKSSFYKYVTISYGDDSYKYGGDAYEFLTSNDMDAHIFWGTGVQNKIISNTAWNNGLLREKITFNSDFDTIRKKEFFYLHDARGDEQNINFYTEKKYDPVLLYDLNYTCTEEDLTKTRTRKYCSTNHNHSWNLVSGNCITGNMQTQVIPHPCNGKTVGAIITNLSALNHVEVMKYKNISHWHYLNKAIETDYFEQGSIEKVIDYTYENSEHLQVTKIETSLSNDTVIQKFYYPQDLLVQDIQPTQMQRLINENRIGEPIKSEVYKNEITATNKLSAKITKYQEFIEGSSNLLLPVKIYSKKGSESIEHFSTEDLKITYDKYDLKGNILQYTPENGIPVSIIWGYNGQYPIAKIEGIAYNVIENLANSLALASQNDDDSCVTGCNEATFRTALNNLFTIPSLAQTLITTYTYNPLIGVTSITPPNGQTAYYDYDGFGRLKSIKDQDGNLLQDIEYHYKTSTP
ncbi:MAG: RHS repeat domain-containing protein [Flavobacteriaceae bacterium]|nr:RHS repeat domain-containing protein [Flavobacteriaceae bacterium]